MKKITLLLVFLAFILLTFSTPEIQATYKGGEFTLSENDRLYLNDLMKATWEYIDFYIAPETGFPYDSPSKWEKTNTTNVGLYLASLSAAHHLGYIKTEDAVPKARKILESMEKIENWKGFFNNWLNVNGITKAEPGPNNISDYNKFPAGLIMIRQEFPELYDECTKFLDKIDWASFYAPRIDGIYFEFDVAAKKMLNPVHISRGEDKLLGAFMTVASGGVPPSTWDHHDKSEETKHGIKYFRPGWQGGGLFMQYICGLFLDESATPLGYSSANFAYAQIRHAHKINYPVWGWSASAAPEGGYLGMGAIIDEVVTPHASALAIDFFPDKVIRNFKKLESLGARPNFEVEDKKHDFGFRDSINVKTGKVESGYLILDQAMLFLSLVNFLEDDLVRKIFAKDPIVQHGYSVLKHYNEVNDNYREKFWEYLDKLNEPYCYLEISLDKDKDYFEPEENFNIKLTIDNQTSNNYNNCKIIWRLLDEEYKKVIKSGNLDINIKSTESKSDIVLPFTMPKKVSGKGVLTFYVSLIDSSNKVIEKGKLPVYFQNFADLQGNWKFNKGDDMAWLKKDFNDSEWAEIKAPGTWEEQGYKDYDGFAWYRKTFTIPKTIIKSWKNFALKLEIGGIDDADEVYINGTKVGNMGSFPPDIKTGYGKKRIYRFPPKLIETNKENVIAVRIHDSGGGGGIYKGPIIIKQ